MTNIQNYIEDYLNEVAAFVREAKRQFETSDLLADVNKDKIPRRGEVFGSNGKIYEYQFHGCGCRFEAADVEVDFDFGPNGRHDGFDAWRISRYLRSLGNSVAVEELDIEIQRLVASGRFHKSGSLIGSSLLYKV